MSYCKNKDENNKCKRIKGILTMPQTMREVYRLSPRRRVSSISHDRERRRRNSLSSDLVENPKERNDQYPRRQAQTARDERNERNLFLTDLIQEISSLPARTQFDNSIRKIVVTFVRREIRTGEGGVEEVVEGEGEDRGPETDEEQFGESEP